MSERSAEGPRPLEALPGALSLAEAAPHFEVAPAVRIGDSDAIAVVLADDVERALAHGLAGLELRSLSRSDLPVVAEPGREPAERVGATARGWTLTTGSDGSPWIERRPVGTDVASIFGDQRFAELLPESVRAVLRDLSELAAPRAVEVLAVGGLVRDLALGLVFQDMDLDLVVRDDAIALAREWSRAGGCEVTRVNPPFGTAACRVGAGLEVDLASMRRERYESPGALPVVERGDFIDDLHRRDFTVNAMAMRVVPAPFGGLVDPMDGMGDLARRILRVHHPLSFVDDPTRMLRAARYRARLGMVLEEETERAQRLALGLGVLDRVSGARVFSELTRIFRERDPVSPISMLARDGVLRAIHPAFDADDAALDRLRGLKVARSQWPYPLSEHDEAIGCLSALLWDQDLAGLEAVVARLTPPGRLGSRLALEIVRTRAAVARLEARADLKPSDVHRILEGLTETLLVPASAFSAERERARIRHEVERSRQIRIAAGGEDLKRLGLTPGPLFGEIQERLFRARLDGEVDDLESELALVRREWPK